MKVNQTMINGDRVKQARELRGLTQAQLAEMTNVTQATIAHIETGRSQPSEENINAIAMVTGFPPSFFKQETVVDFPMGSLLFRARSSMTSGQRQEAHRYAQTLFGVTETLAPRLKMPPLRLPRIANDPNKAAELARSALGLSPDTPIDNLIHAVEKGGVLVLVVPTPLEARDAFSGWAGLEEQKPVIIISAGAPGDRLRFSVAHELGHLVLHQALVITQAAKGNLNEVEEQADQFASEFLMPEVAMHREISKPVTLSSLVDLKKRWKVSIQALIHRAYDLGIITERQYRYLFEQLSAAGWRKDEPGKLAVERPRAFRKMAERLYTDPATQQIDYQKLANDTHLTVQFVKQILEGHLGKEDIGSTPTMNTPDAGKLIPFDRNRTRCS